MLKKVQLDISIDILVDKETYRGMSADEIMTKILSLPNPLGYLAYQSPVITPLEAKDA